MKTNYKGICLFILTLTLYLSSSSAFAQVYSPFPTDTAEWTLRERCPDGNGNQNIHGYYNILKGDTVVDGVSYKKLYQSYVENINSPNQTLVCLLREDLKKIYVRFLYKGLIRPDTNEFVLYDFNSAVGDTFKVTLLDVNYTLYNTKFIVSQIGNYTTNQGVRKKYVLKLLDYFPETTLCNSDTILTWIEGVGSDYGPLYGESLRSCHYMVPDQCDSKLLCFQDSSSYIIGGDSTCSFISNTESIINHDGELSVIPNPVSSGTLMINTSLLIEKIEIYNILGEKIMLTTTASGVIDVSGFTKGVYILKIYDNKKNAFNRKVIIE